MKLENKLIYIILILFLKQGEKIFSIFKDKKKKDKIKIKFFKEDETNSFDTINTSKKDIIVKIKIILNMNV